MNYPKSAKYNLPIINEKIMGPNPIKLEEELMLENRTPDGSVVLDLGSGQGVTSVFLVNEYDFTIYAADLWSEPEENRNFFDKMGISRDKLIPVKADALQLPFEKEFFDAVVCTDSYNFFGRDPEYLDRCLLPFVKPGGYIYIAVPGMRRDCHDNLTSELLLSWTPEQMEYMHDVAWWKDMVSRSSARVIFVDEMQSNDEVWRDWLACENEYAVNDRKSMNAGAGKYLNFIRIILQKPED